MENQTPSFHPLDYLSVLRRRVWWLITPIVLAAIVAAALVTWLPRTYKTSATLGVAIAAMSQELVTGNQRVSAEERLRNIRQVLLSPPVLERVVKEEGLDKDTAIADAVGKVRSGIELTLPKPDPNLPPGSIEQFFIGYSDDTPDRTQSLTNRLADAFVQESSHRREVRAEETSQFIGMQVQQSQMRLGEIEERLRKARESFMGALPEQTQANVAMVTGLQQQLETTTNAIRGEQDRLSMVERQIDTMKGAPSGDPSSPGLPAAASATAVRVMQLERELATAQTNYTARHPEVIRLREELTSAKAAAAAEASRPESERTASLSVDPTYRSLLGDREQGRLRLRELQRQEEQIRAQIGTYRSRVDSAPRVQQQIATLDREYTLEKDQYGALTTRLRNSETSENLVRNRGGEEFAVLSRAPRPSEPASPNTQRLILFTMLAGICLGGALALGREYLDRSIYDSRSLNDLELPVLGEIPRIAAA